MTNRRSGMVSKLVIGLALGACMIVVRPAAAQSTIFNIPTTDTVAPGKGYFEFDFLHLVPGDNGWTTFMPRIVYGVNDKVEVGVNLNNTHYPAFGTAPFVQPSVTDSVLQPNAKIKFLNDDSQGLAAAAGIILYVPVNHRDDLDTFGQVYANVSKKLKSGTRVTVGPYASISYGNDNQVGVLAGLEQPINPKVSFVVDWFSGKNFWGYLTPGVSIVLAHNGLLNIGYSIGNDQDFDNNAFFAYYGITFN